MNFVKSLTQLFPIPKPKYEPPRITTYTDEQLLELLGPVQAGDSLNDENNVLQRLANDEENPWGDD